MARIVTMADFYALKEACTRLEQASLEGAELAMDGQQIVLAAELQGKIAWAQRFANEATANLSELHCRLTAECMAAAERFTGERPAPGESFESYWPRVGAALSDGSCVKLDAMMRRNGITLINDGS